MCLHHPVRNSPFHIYQACLIFSTENENLLAVCVLRQIDYDSQSKTHALIRYLQSNFKKLWGLPMLIVGIVNANCGIINANFGDCQC